MSPNKRPSFGRRPQTPLRPRQVDNTLSGDATPMVDRIGAPRTERPLFSAGPDGGFLLKKSDSAKWISMGLLVLSACRPPASKETIWVTIPPGASLEAITDSLVANEIITSPGAFQKLARMGRADLGIKPGLYDLNPNTPIGQVLVTLRKGRDPVRRVVVTKGIWLSEVAILVERDMGIERESFLAAAGSDSLLFRLGVRGTNAEGYVYPSVYYLNVGASAEEIVNQFADTFEVHWNPEWDHRSDSLGLTRDEVVTLASIIEGEGAVEEDLRTIASVYHNRLRRGMRLQADPTVVYALGERRRLLNRNYRTESPFNTYVISGLPPSPIGNPSTNSLEAALYPDSTDFLYFVAQPDGHHRFSLTFDEHLRAIGEIRR